MAVMVAIHIFRLVLQMHMVVEEVMGPKEVIVVGEVEDMAEWGMEETVFLRVLQVLLFLHMVVEEHMVGEVLYTIMVLHYHHYSAEEDIV